MNRDSSPLRPAGLSKRELIWRYGVCRWGLPTAVSLAVLRELDEVGSIAGLVSWSFLVHLLIALVLVALGGGALFGWSFWMLLPPRVQK